MMEISNTGPTQTITQSGLVTALPPSCKGILLYATSNSNATFGKDAANALTPVPNIALPFYNIPLYIVMTTGTVYATPLF